MMTLQDKQDDRAQDDWAQSVESSVLRDIARYRLMTVRAVRNLPGNPTRTAKSARRLLEKMHRKRLIQRAPLVRRESYYYLDSAAYHSLETAPRHGAPSGPLSERAKIRAYAVLGFCCLGAVRRQLLLADELARVYPPLARGGQGGSYYLDAHVEPPRLGLLRIDVGGAARWDRIVYKLRADVRQHRQASLARGLIESGQLEFAVVTTLPAKAERIGQALSGLAEFRDVKLCISSMPALLPLVAPAPSKSRKRRD